jgi:class 3 adenylate cyclase
VGVTLLALATTAGCLVRRTRRIYRTFVPRKRPPNSGRCLAEGTVVEVIRAERRLVAIMAADIVGYSRLNEADEASTLSTIRISAAR